LALENGNCTDKQVDRMKTARTIMLAAVAALLTVTTSRGVTFSDFEAPTYNAGAELGGQDGWTITIGSPARGRVTPTFDADLGATVSTVLDGSQSAYVKTAVHALRGWNGLENFVQNDIEISWLMQVAGFTRAEVYLTPDLSGLSTPIGVQFQSDGDIIAATPNTGFVDIGDYVVSNTYRFVMSVDFTAATTTFFMQDVTGGGALTNLHTGNTGAISSNDYQVGGGLIFVEREGVHMFIDTIEISNPNVQPPTVAFTNIVVDDVAGMEFASALGSTYRLKASDGMVTNFQPTGAILEGTGQNLVFFDPTGPSTSKVYRIEVTGP